VKLVIDGDTLVAITVEQAKTINQSFLDARHYKTVNDSLGQKIVLLESMADNDSLIIKSTI
jgi:hypothetical protein